MSTACCPHDKVTNNQFNVVLVDQGAILVYNSGDPCTNMDSL